MESPTKENMPKKSNRNLLYRLIIVVIVIVIIGSLYYYETVLPQSTVSGTPLTLYIGEISSQTYGFGSTANSLTSNPGPTLTLVAGQTYTITVHNVGTMQHNWATVDHKATNANVLWAAVTPFINAGSSSQVTFKAGSAGNYVYICQVPGHIALGLWGTVVVNP